MAFLRGFPFVDLVFHIIYCLTVSIREHTSPKKFLGVTGICLFDLFIPYKSEDFGMYYMIVVRHRRFSFFYLFEVFLHKN